MNGGVEVTIHSQTINVKSGGQIGGQIGGITDKQRDVLTYIIEDPKITRKTLAERFGINESAIQKHIKALITQKIIERVGTKKGYWKLLIKQ